MKKNIKILRKKFKKYKIDGYVVPKNDDYACRKRIGV